MAVWLLAPDPAGTCCDCSQRMLPCDSCSSGVSGACCFTIPTCDGDGGHATPYANLALAQSALTNRTVNCLLETYAGFPPTTISASADNILTVNGTIGESTPTSQASVFRYLYGIYATGSTHIITSGLITSPVSVSSITGAVILTDSSGCSIVTPGISAGNVGQSTLSTSLSLSIPAAGKYTMITVSEVKLTAGHPSQSCSFSASGLGVSFCTIRAAYVDPSDPTQVLYTKKAECPVCNDFLQCRSIGGSATMCGNSEYFTGPPPPIIQFYRKISINGAMRICKYSTDLCPVIPGSFVTTDTYTYGGDCIYDIDTCIGDNGISLSLSYGEVEDGATCGNGIGVITDNVCNANAGTVLSDYNYISSTHKQYVGGCVPFVSPGTWDQVGSIDQVLSDQDTEPDAIARLLSNSVWSDWNISTIDFCTAKYQPRTGRNFIYTDIQWLVRKQDLLPSTSYNVIVKIFRRVYGSSAAWTLYQTLTYMGNTDASGLLEVTDYVPNDSGFESYIDSDVVVSL